MKTFILVATLLTVGSCFTKKRNIQNALPQPSAISRIPPPDGFCVPFMRCMAQSDKEILQFRTALDLYQFNNTFNAEALKKSCSLRQSLSGCLKNIKDKACDFSSYARIARMNNELLGLTCDKTPEIELTIGCFTDSEFQEVLAFCLTLPLNKLALCRQFAFDNVDICDTCEAEKIFDGVTEIYNKFLS